MGINGFCHYHVVQFVFFCIRWMKTFESFDKLGAGIKVDSEGMLHRFTPFPTQIYTDLLHSQILYYFSLSKFNWGFSFKLIILLPNPQMKIDM